MCVSRAGITGATRVAMATSMFGRIKWRNVEAYIQVHTLYSMYDTHVPQLVRLLKMSQTALYAGTIFFDIVQGGVVFWAHS